MGREASRVSWPISDDRLTVPGRDAGRRSFDAMRSKPGPVVRGIRLGRSRISVLPIPRTAFLQTVCRSMVLRNLYHIKRKLRGQAGMAERSHPGRLAGEQAGDRSNMIADSDEVGGLARGVVGSARTIAFGTSIVA